jgi:hypothetical protein
MAKSTTDPFGRTLVLRDGLLQEDVAAWARAYVQMPRVGLPEQCQAALQAAIVAGWIESPETSAQRLEDIATGKAETVYLFDGVDVRKLTAAEVKHYGLMMDAHYTALTTVPNPKK